MSEGAKAQRKGATEKDGGRGMETWTLVALIEPGFFLPERLMTESVTLAPNTTLGPVPRWARQPRSFRRVLEAEHKRAVRSSVFAFQSTWKQPPGKRAGETDPRLRRLAERRIRNAALGLWLARPVHFALPFFVVGCRNAKSRQRVPRWEGGWGAPNLRFYSYSMSSGEGDVREGARLTAGLEALGDDGSVWIAARALWQSIGAQAEVAYLLRWIALEALFGSRDPTEATYRLRERMALFVANSEVEAESLFKKISRWYRARSDIVHGKKQVARTENEAEQMTKYAEEVDELLRSALKTILLEPGLREEFNDGERREKWLGSLVFKRRTWPTWRDTAPEAAGTSEGLGKGGE